MYWWIYHVGLLRISLDCINEASISNGNIVFLQVSQQNGAKKMPWGPLSFLFKSRNALDDSVVEVRVKIDYVLVLELGACETFFLIKMTITQLVGTDHEFIKYITRMQFWTIVLKSVPSRKIFFDTILFNHSFIFASFSEAIETWNNDAVSLSLVACETQCVPKPIDQKYHKKYFSKVASVKVKFSPMINVQVQVLTTSQENSKNDHLAHNYGNYCNCKRFFYVFGKILGLYSMR